MFQASVPVVSFRLIFLSPLCFSHNGFLEISTCSLLLLPWLILTADMYISQLSCQSSL